MPITINTSSSSGGSPPSVHLPDVGSFLEFALVDSENVPEYDFATGQQIIHPDGHPRAGQPKMQCRITGVAIRHTGAQVGNRDERRPPTPGETITIYAAKSTFGEWIDAQKAHGQLNVGDVVRYWYDHDEKPSRAGFNPRKVRQFAIRAPKPDETDQTEHAENLWRERQQPTERQPVDTGYTAAQMEPF